MEITVSENSSGLRLDKFLLERYNFSLSTLAKMVRKNGIRVNGKHAKALSLRLIQNDIVKLYLPQNFAISERKTDSDGIYISSEQIVWFKSLKIADSDDWFAINKPRKVASQRGSGITEPALDDFAKALNPEYRLVHRLDRETTGVMMFAKSRDSAKNLTLAFAENTIKKEYLAVVLGNFFAQKTVKTSLVYGQHNVVCCADGGAENALTAFTEFDLVATALIPEFGSVSLVRARPQTGRKHQIRVHLASIQYPILGDEKYGGSAIGDGQILLHARSITLPCETVIQTQVPISFTEIFGDFNKMEAKDGKY